jgi:elongation factor G
LVLKEVILKNYEISKIRNIVLGGHQSSGKTTLAEAILFNSGATNRMGKVEDGNTMLDYTVDEIERSISINSALASCEVEKNKINILDTPGYEDFVGEVLSCLKVVESGILVMNADAGVEVGMEKIWDYMDQYELPRMICLNKMDKEHVNFENSVEESRKVLGKRIMPVFLPIGEGDSFRGVVDVLNEKAYIYSDEGGSFSEQAVPEELSERASEIRQNLMDFAAESDDSLLEKFLEEGKLSDEELETGLAAGCAAGTLVPLIPVSAVKNIGIKQLMNLIIRMLPSPEAREEIGIRRGDSEETEGFKCSPDGETLAFVFKSFSEKHLGDLSYIRVFSGEVVSGKDLYNSTLKTSERMSQLFFLQGKKRIDTGSIGCGDLGTAVKLKNTKINHTLCAHSSDVIISEVDYPEPNIRTAVIPKTKSDIEKVGTGLAKLSEEDPTFSMNVDSETKQTILSGQGELQLNVILDRLKRRFEVEVDTATPRVPYRETVSSSAEAQGKHKKQSGGRGQYGDVWLRIEPLSRGEGFEFVNAVYGGSVPSNYIPAVEKGVVAAMNNGVVAGYRMQDLKVTLYDGSSHPVDSSDQAFKVAGSKGFKEAAKNAKPVLLEPIMNVEVTVPEKYTGDVMGDLSMRRGKIMGTEQEGKFQKIKVQVPLAELHRYSTSLRSMTQGRASHRREFSHYEVVPHEVAQKVIAEAEKKEEEE